MIPNQWYAILETNEVKKGRPVGVRRMGENLVAWRDRQGRVTVMADRCPHRGAALRIGKLTGDCIQCPFHGFEYDASGTCTLVPANGRDTEPPKALHVKTYPAREEHGLIYIWWGEPREPEAYPPIPFFANITERMVFSTVRTRWQNHYGRAIENQLDVVHLPFVHYNTIGSDGRTLVHGPLAKEVRLGPGSYRIDLWVDNDFDRGQKPRKPSEMPDPGRRPLIQFAFPNLWQNWLSDDFLVFLAFAPIDEENTMMYLRLYHRVRFPILRQLVEFFGQMGNRYILAQDKRVVVTQRPHCPDPSTGSGQRLGIGEILIQGDSPIVTYRKRRRALIEGRD